MLKIGLSTIAILTLVSCSSLDKRTFDSLSHVYTFDYTGHHADHWDYEYSKRITQDEFDQMIDEYDGIEFTTPMVLGRGVYDFQNKPVRYIGGGGCTAHKGLKESSTVFLVFQHGVVVKNLSIYKSAQDGISTYGDVELHNVNVYQSCDEALTVREQSNLSVYGGSFYNKYNKAFMIKPYSTLKLDGVTVVAEQGIAPCDTDNKVYVKNSTFKVHTGTEDSTVFTGDDCDNTIVYWQEGNKLSPNVRFTSIESGEDITYIK